MPLAVEINSGTAKATLLVIFLSLLTGCANIPGLSGVFSSDYAPAPAEVRGKTVSELSAQTGNRSCDILSSAHQQRMRLHVERLEELVNECAMAFDQVIAEQRASQIIADLEVAWAQQRDAEKARQASLQQHRLEALRARQAAARAASAETTPEEHKVASFVPSDSNIASLLRNIADLPLAYTLGEPTRHSLITFMACLEREYPNAGYEIDQRNDVLVITANQAQMLRGEVAIRVSVQRVWDNWILQSLTVANVRASGARDRISLAESLLADTCPGASD